jgi:glycerol-3-phosphate cytidylyltransferase
MQNTLSNELILYTGGTFDLFHSGHVNFLKHCKKLSHKVIVCLNTDEFIEQYKGKKPIVPYQDRLEVLTACRYVDDVVPNLGGSDSKISILLVKPDIIAVGDDWAKKDYYKQMSFTQQWLDNNDITLVYIPYKQGISSTLLKSKI